MINKKLSTQIKKLFEITNKKKEFVPGKSRIKLIEPTFDYQEIIDSLDSLISTQVTMGRKVKRFEKIFALYCKTKYSTMVNSGSSANLLAISILTNPEFKNKIKPHSEVITPAVTWPTTIFPLVNMGLKPKFVDIDLDTYCINTDLMYDAVTKETGLLLPVHLLGNVCDMGKICELANEKNFLIMEDCCEAHGALFKNKHVGTFGAIGTFSFFLSHHITTIEGGMIITDDDVVDELSKMLRAFGWIRDIKNKKMFISENPDIDPRFLFRNLGFNLRPTEIQGAFGINQISKLQKFIKIRKENTEFWNKALKQYSDYLILPREQKNCKQSYFCYPITIKHDAPFNRDDLTKYLENKKIETRSIMSGNMIAQPVMRLIEYSKHGKLTNSELVMRNSFLFGNHQGIGKEERQFVAKCIIDFIERKIRIRP